MIGEARRYPVCLYILSEFDDGRRKRQSHVDRKVFTWERARAVSGKNTETFHDVIRAIVPRGLVNVQPERGCDFCAAEWPVVIDDMITSFSGGWHKKSARRNDARKRFTRWRRRGSFESRFMRPRSLISLAAGARHEKTFGFRETRCS